MATHDPDEYLDGLAVRGFADAGELWAWMEKHHSSHQGLWVRLQKTKSPIPSVSFHDLLEAGIAFGWSESTRRAGDALSYLQRFTPRRGKGTTSERNRRIASQLEADGRMTAAGRRALGLPA